MLYVDILTTCHHDQVFGGPIVGTYLLGLPDLYKSEPTQHLYVGEATQPERPHSARVRLGTNMLTVRATPFQQYATRACKHDDIRVSCTGVCNDSFLEFASAGMSRQCTGTGTEWKRTKQRFEVFLVRQGAGRAAAAHLADILRATNTAAEGETSVKADKFATRTLIAIAPTVARLHVLTYASVVPGAFAFDDGYSMADRAVYRRRAPVPTAIVPRTAVPECPRAIRHLHEAARGMILENQVNYAMPPTTRAIIYRHLRTGGVVQGQGAIAQADEHGRSSQAVLAPWKQTPPGAHGSVHTALGTGHWTAEHLAFFLDATCEGTVLRSGDVASIMPIEIPWWDEAVKARRAAADPATMGAGWGLVYIAAGTGKERTLKVAESLEAPAGARQFDGMTIRAREAAREGEECAPPRMLPIDMIVAAFAPALRRKGRVESRATDQAEQYKATMDCPDTPRLLAAHEHWVACVANDAQVVATILRAPCAAGRVPALLSASHHTAQVELSPNPEDGQLITISCSAMEPLRARATVSHWIKVGAMDSWRAAVAQPDTTTRVGYLMAWCVHTHASGQCTVDPVRVEATRNTAAPTIIGMSPPLGGGTADARCSANTTGMYGRMVMNRGSQLHSTWIQVPKNAVVTSLPMHNVYAGDRMAMPRRWHASIMRAHTRRSVQAMRTRSGPRAGYELVLAPGPVLMRPLMAEWLGRACEPTEHGDKLRVTPRGSTRAISPASIVRVAEAHEYVQRQTNSNRTRAGGVEVDPGWTWPSKSSHAELDLRITGLTRTGDQYTSVACKGTLRGAVEVGCRVDLLTPTTEFVPFPVVDWLKKLAHSKRDVGGASSDDTCCSDSESDSVCSDSTEEEAGEDEHYIHAGVAPQTDSLPTREQTDARRALHCAGYSPTQIIDCESTTPRAALHTRGRAQRRVQYMRNLDDLNEAQSRAQRHREKNAAQRTVEHGELAPYNAAVHGGKEEPERSAEEEEARETDRRLEVLAQCANSKGRIKHELTVVMLQRSGLLSAWAPTPRRPPQHVMRAMADPAQQRGRSARGSIGWSSIRTVAKTTQERLQAATEELRLPPTGTGAGQGARTLVSVPEFMRQLETRAQRPFKQGSEQSSAVSGVLEEFMRCSNLGGAVNATAKWEFSVNTAHVNHTS